MLDAELKPDPAPEEVLFVVNASGVDTLDEITQSRAALYQRVYLHPVTRTAEAILGRALESNIRLAEEQGDPDLRDALRLWSLSDSELLRRLSQSGDADVSRFGTALKGRLLPKKACVFSASIAEMHMPLKHMFRSLDPSKADDLRKLIVNTKLETLTADAMQGAGGRALEARIRAEAEHLASVLRESGAPPELIPEISLEDLVVVGTSYMDHGRKDCVVLQNGELLRTSKFTNVLQTQDAFDIVKAVGFVMSDPQWAPIVLLASRVVLGTPVGPPKAADFPSPSRTESDPSAVYLVERTILDLKGVLRRAGLPREKFDATLEAATAARYFDSAPLFARPVDSGSAAVRNIADRLASFDGEGTWRVRPQTVAAFVSQFPPHLREAMIERLGQFAFFDSETITTDLVACIRRLSGPIDIVPLSPSSGVPVANALRRGLPDTISHTVHFELSQALANPEDRPLIFVDDNSSSATQARAQFLQWLGVPRASWPVECQSEDHLFLQNLSDSERQALKVRPTYVAVCAGRTEANVRLQELLASNGVTAFKGLIFAKDIDVAIDWPADLREFLTEVGKSILTWANRGVPATDEVGQFIDANSFGYGNVGALLATPTNVPTSTVTAVWCPGTYRNVPWLPLLLRQKKLRHLVLG